MQNLDAPPATAGTGTATASFTTVTTTPMVSLLLALLRASVSKANLPAIERYVHRKFPLPEAAGASDSPPPSADVVVAEQFFAEACMANGVVPPIVMPPMTTIEVRHVQPMAMGPHYQCGHACPPTPEAQFRRTAAISKRAIFEQVSRLSRPPGEPGLAVVYDVMEDRVAEAIEDGGPECTLRFDSRFESGNLQMAIKVAQEPVDLVLRDRVSFIGGHSLRYITHVHLPPFHVTRSTWWSTICSCRRTSTPPSVGTTSGSTFPSNACKPVQRTSST